MIGGTRMLIALQGFLLGLSYVAPIGMQNLYVINSAVSLGRQRALGVALITIFFDIALAVACYFGIGAIIDSSSFLKGVILLVGSCTVIYIGQGIFRSKPKLETVDVQKSTARVIRDCFVVTWLNPQAIIDGSLLLGSFRATLSADLSHLFILGVCIASATWFLSLSTITSTFKGILNENILSIINKVCGSVVVFYGIKLLIQFIGLYIPMS